MSNVLANLEIDRRNAQADPEEIKLTLDRDEAEALYTLLGILSTEGDEDLAGIFDELNSFCYGESDYVINEPTDTLALRRRIV